MSNLSTISHPPRRMVGLNVWIKRTKGSRKEWQRNVASSPVAGYAYLAQFMRTITLPIWEGKRPFSKANACAEHDPGMQAFVRLKDLDSRSDPV